jgi:AAA+ ATPase superfamily predicted ATPase
MLDYLYPVDERALFTDRDYYLGLLDLCGAELQQGRRKHLALLGLRRIGKTLILKEFILRWLQRPAATDVPRVLPIYMDLKRLGLSPESFAVEYIGSVLYWFLEKGEGRWDEYARLPTLLRATSALGNPRVLDMVLELDADLRQQVIPQRRLLELAFNFPEILAREQGVRFLICIDEFQDLGLLSNFPQVGDVLDVFRSELQTQSAVAYVAAGSAISLMEGIFHQARSPLFVHFRSERVGPFGRAESDELARKALVGEELSAEAAQTIYAWTRGHPFYIYAVAERMRELILLSGREADVQLVREAFVLETLSSAGRIYNLCRYVIEESMGKARGQALLRLLLQILAESENPLTLTELAQRLRRPAGATRALLNRLAEVDLVAQQDGAYDLPDPVLKIWLAYFHAGVELLAVPRREILEGLVTDMAERYQRLSSELGLAKESQVREILTAFDGRQAPGRLFGRSAGDTVWLPAFTRVAAYQSQDGQIELDAVAEGPASWLVEVKWRHRPVSRADLAAFAQKARTVVERLKLASAATLWLISGGGFKASALEYAADASILVSNAQEVQELAELLRVRFGK